MQLRFLIAVLAVASPLLTHAAEFGGKENIVDNHGVDIHYTVYGSGQPPFLVLTHGFPDRATTWFNQVTYFTKQGYTVITPTLRGYPPSGVPLHKSEYDAAHFVSDMLAVFHHARLRKPVYLLGHDVGGVVVQRFAQAHPGLISTLTMVNTPIIATFLPLIEFDNEQQSLSTYTLNYYKYEPGQPKNATFIARHYRNATYRHSIVKYLNDSPLFGMLNFYNENFPGPPYLDLSSFNYSVATWSYRLPAQIIYGLEDPYFSIRMLDGLSKWFTKGLRLSTIPDAGHWSFHDAPNKFNNELLSFITSNQSVMK